MSQMPNQPQFNAEMSVVILHGKEQFLMQRYSEMLQETLKDKYKAIDTIKFDGSQVDIATVMDEVRTYDLLMRHKVVIIDKAEIFLASKDSVKKSPRKIFENYVTSPAEHTTILMRATTWRPGKLDKLVSNVGLVYKIQQLNETDIIRWCIGRAKKVYDCDFRPEAARLITQRIGTSLIRLDLEIKKLSASISPKKTISVENVLNLVGLSREEQVWEMQLVLLSGNLKNAMLKLDELLQISNQPKELLMWSIVDLARRLNATSELLDDGYSIVDIRKSLKLFGKNGDLILSSAKKHKTKKLADLFTYAVSVDAKTRSGLLTSQHGLQELLVHFCDFLRH